MKSKVSQSDVKRRISRIIVALGVLNAQAISATAQAAEASPLAKVASQFADAASAAFNLAAFQDSFPDAWDDGIGSFTKWLDDVPPDWDDGSMGCSNWDNGDASC